MSAKIDQFLCAEDFDTIKGLIDSEITRRSNSKSVGPLSEYKDNSYTVEPS